MVKKLRENVLTAHRPRLDMVELSVTPRKTQASGPRRNPAKTRKFSPRRVGYVLLLGICGLAAIGVPMNALFFQDARHPAPMFLTNSFTSTAATPTLEKTKAGHPAETAAARDEGPKSKAETGRAPLKNENARTEPPPPAKTQNGPSAKLADTRKRDPIAELLNGPVRAEKPAQSDVMMAQQALLKLGYVVRADGKFNKATQKAIEKFEHDNGMPVKGALTTKIAAMLASRAGLESE